MPKNEIDVYKRQEPTNGLDPIGIAEVRNFIKDLSVDRGKTILISSHILSEIALLADDIGTVSYTHLDVYKRQTFLHTQA